MKILHLVHCYYPAIGGTENYVKEISERLVNNYKDEVAVYCSANINPEQFVKPLKKTLKSDIINNVKIKRFTHNFLLTKIVHKLLKFFNHKNKCLFIELIRWLSYGPISLTMFYNVIKNVKHYDTVMVSGLPFVHVLYGFIGAKVHNKKFIIRGMIHQYDKKFDNRLFYKIYKYSDYCIVNTDSEKQFLINKGIDSEKIVKTYFGIPGKNNFDKTKNQDFIKQYNIPDNREIVLFVGQKTDYKRIDFLIDAMKIVWSKNKNVCLVLCGSSYPEYSKQIEIIINNLDSEFKKNIVNINDFDESVKPYIYHNSNILVLPSIYESFGLVFLEAWLYKKPVIGTDIQPFKEIIDDNVTGLIFKQGSLQDLADKILYLLNNKQIQFKLGENGYNQLEKKYNWNKITEQIRNLAVRN